MANKNNQENKSTKPSNTTLGKLSTESKIYDPLQNAPNDAQFTREDDWRHYDPCGINWMKEENNLFSIISQNGIRTGLDSVQLKKGEVLVMAKVEAENAEIFVPRTNFKATTAKYFGFIPYILEKSVLKKTRPDLSEKINSQQIV